LSDKRHQYKIDAADEGILKKRRGKGRKRESRGIYYSKKGSRREKKLVSRRMQGRVRKRSIARQDGIGVRESQGRKKKAKQVAGLASGLRSEDETFASSGIKTLLQQQEREKGKKLPKKSQGGDRKEKLLHYA